MRVQLLFLNGAYNCKNTKKQLFSFQFQYSVRQMSSGKRNVHQTRTSVLDEERKDDSDDESDSDSEQSIKQMARVRDPPHVPRRRGVPYIINAQQMMFVYVYNAYAYITPDASMYRVTHCDFSYRSALYRSVSIDVYRRARFFNE